MKLLSISQIKKELQEISHPELMALALTLIKYKKENKELISYSLTHSLEKTHYIQELKDEMDELFKEVKVQNVYLFKKVLRKILRWTKKYIKFNDSKIVEVELLIHFCKNLMVFKQFLKSSKIIQNLFNSQVKIIEQNLEKFHEDLKFDYHKDLESLKKPMFNL